MNKIITLFALLFLPLLTETAFACSCSDWEQRSAIELGIAPFEGKSYIESYKKSGGAIFIGKVLKIRKVKSPAKEDNWYNREITFSVSKGWTGAETSKLVVYTNKSGAACGYNFEKGENYVVFASKEPESLLAETYGDKLSVGMCSYTTLLTAAKNILKGLGDTKVSF